MELLVKNFQIDSIINPMTNSSGTVYTYVDGCVKYAEKLLQNILDLTNPELKQEDIFKVIADFDYSDTLCESIADKYQEELDEYCSLNNINIEIYESYIENKNIEKISEFLFYFFNKGKAPIISDDYLIVTIKNVLYKHFSNIEFQIYKFFDELSNEIDKDYASNKVNYRSYEALNYNDYYCDASIDYNDIKTSTSLSIYVKEGFKEKYKQIASNICSIANNVEGEYSYNG